MSVRPAVFDEWLRARCDLLTEKESFDLTRISLRKLADLGSYPLGEWNDKPNFSEGYVAYLEKKSAAALSCEFRVKDEALMKALSQY